VSRALCGGVVAESSRPIHEILITSKVAWLVAFAIGALVAVMFDWTNVPEFFGTISVFGLMACVSQWQNDPKAWAIVFLIGLIVGVEFGGIRVFV
jgi:hypothetical protein